MRGTGYYMRATEPFTCQACGFKGPGSKGQKYCQPDTGRDCARVGERKRRAREARKKRAGMVVA